MPRRAPIPSLIITALSLLALLSPSLASAQSPRVANNAVATFPANYRCIPFHDSVYSGGPQHIPGRLQNEYYDMLPVSDADKKAGAEEGQCYHDTDRENKGSGKLNATGSYLREFRMFESPGISYTKFHNPNIAVDDSPYNFVLPDSNSLYLGWVEATEWVNYTVTVAESGDYSITTLYSSQRGGHISFDVNGKDATGPIAITSTRIAADTIAWRQAHHWNKATILPRIHLDAGTQVLTLHFLDQPEFNFDYMDFVRVR